MNKGFFFALGVIVLIALAIDIKRSIPRSPFAPIFPKKPAPSPLRPKVRQQLVYVTSKNCTYCVKMDKQTFADPKVSKILADEYAFTKVSGEEATKYKVKGFPTYILFDDAGHELLRGSGYKGPDDFIAWLGGVPREEIDTDTDASVGGKVAPDGKTEIQIDLPAALHLKNVGGSDGAGLCVFTSISHSARWCNVGLLADFRDWMKKYPGGGYPTKVDQKIAQIAKEKGVTPPSYLNVEGGKEILDVLRAACASGRMPGVTYSFSPTKRYGGQKIAHMVSLVHLDDKHACVLDNNFPGIDKYEWMSVEEFLRTFTGGRSGWAVILLDPGPPPLPWNQE